MLHTVDNKQVLQMEIAGAQDKQQIKQIVATCLTGPAPPSGWAEGLQG